MAEATADTVDRGALGEAKADPVDGAYPSYWYDDESDCEIEYDDECGGADRSIPMEDKINEEKKRILMDNKRSYGAAFTETESSSSSVDPSYDEYDDFTTFRLVDDWDSEDDLRFDRADFVEEYVGFIVAWSPKKYEDEFIEHYLTVCKSRGYDLDTVPPPKSMRWPVTEWLKKFPEQKYKEIEPVLKDRAFPIIKEKSGKDLELEEIQVVNVWNRGSDGRFYYITFRAKDKSKGGTSALYQTRLVLDPEPGCFHCISSRLLSRIGMPGPVHAFRLKPDQTN